MSINLETKEINVNRLDNERKQLERFPNGFADDSRGDEGDFK